MVSGRLRGELPEYSVLQSCDASPGPSGGGGDASGVRVVGCGYRATVGGPESSLSGVSVLTMMGVSVDVCTSGCLRVEPSAKRSWYRIDGTVRKRSEFYANYAPSSYRALNV